LQNQYVVDVKYTNRHNLDVFHGQLYISW